MPAPAAGWQLQLERDESEQTVAHYTIGAGLEAMRREASSFYHYNHLGTALALTGANEAVTDTYRHDAWGVLLASTGSTVNPHTYVGRERYYRMPEAAMYHLGFRDYAQGVGRFRTVDPRCITALAFSWCAQVTPIPLLIEPVTPSIRRPTRRLSQETDGPFIVPVNFSDAYSYVSNAPSVKADAVGLFPESPGEWRRKCVELYQACLPEEDFATAVAACLLGVGLLGQVPVRIACARALATRNPWIIAAFCGGTGLAWMIAVAFCGDHVGRMIQQQILACDQMLERCMCYA